MQLQENHQRCGVDQFPIKAHDLFLLYTSMPTITVFTYERIIVAGVRLFIHLVLLLISFKRMPRSNLLYITGLHSKRSSPHQLLFFLFLFFESNKDTKILALFTFPGNLNLYGRICVCLYWCLLKFNCRTKKHHLNSKRKLKSQGDLAIVFEI